MDCFYESDQYRKTALMVAAELGYTEVLIALLSNPKFYKNSSYLGQKTSPDNLDVLSLAVKKGHLEVVRILLTDPHIESSMLQILDFRTALQQAAKFGHTEIFKLIASCPACPPAVLDAAIEQNKSNATPPNRFGFWSSKSKTENQLEQHTLEKFKQPLQELNKLLMSEYSGNQFDVYRLAQSIKTAIKKFATSMNHHDLLKHLKTITCELTTDQYQLKLTDQTKIVNIVEQIVRIGKTEQIREEIKSAENHFSK